ncbi:exodeoxyribonuclease VII small subunit [Ghiorsea bivora]|uniref:exodeoxyribonuclease VII small subunit n=1 Tax=Ghiorsea bivora TaxID=1485545 RepID=UPI000570E0E9
MVSKDKHQDLSFEQALDGLTTMVEKLESGKLSLEDSVKAFEEGVILTRQCEKLLDDAEQRLQILDADGER